MARRNPSARTTEGLKTQLPSRSALYAGEKQITTVYSPLEPFGHGDLGILTAGETAHVYGYDPSKMVEFDTKCTLLL